MKCAIKGHTSLARRDSRGGIRWYCVECRKARDVRQLAKRNARLRRIPIEEIEQNTGARERAVREDR
jgi:hypothetical protein